MNAKLHTWGTEVSPNATTAANKTLEHALVDCHFLKHFAQQIQQLINNIKTHTIHLTESIVLLGLGLFKNTKKVQLIKFIIHRAKRSYWKNRVTCNFVKNTPVDPVMWSEFVWPANQRPNSTIKKKAHTPLRTS